MDWNTFPRKSPKSDLDNRASLTTSIKLACGMTDADAKHVVDELFEAEGWSEWAQNPPQQSGVEIVGVDALGYVHLATHLVGSDGQWVDQWKSVGRP